MDSKIFLFDKNIFLSKKYFSLIKKFSLEKKIFLCKKDEEYDFPLIEIIVKSSIRDNVGCDQALKVKNKLITRTRDLINS